MAKTHNSGRKPSSVSIWDASAGKVSSDADETKKTPIPIIGIEALRNINRIVVAIQERLGTRQETRPGNDDGRTSPEGDPGGPKTTSSNCGTGNNRDEEEHQ